MADLVQQQTAILQQTAVLVGLHPTDFQLLSQSESDLWTTYEAKLTQKFGPAVVAKIKENPDPLDRVLALIDKARVSLLGDSAGNLALDNIKANLKILRSSQKTFPKISRLRKISSRYCSQSYSRAPRNPGKT